MSLLTSFLGEHLFKIMLTELEAQEPAIQGALMQLGSEIIAEIKAKIDSKLAGGSNAAS